MERLLRTGLRGVGEGRLGMGMRLRLRLGLGMGLRLGLGLGLGRRWGREEGGACGWAAFFSSHSG